MRSRQFVIKRDFYAGGLIAVLGAAVALQSTRYDLGTMTQMGPGMFPLILGVILTVIGALIFGGALATPAGDERILPEQKQWRGWACVLAGPILFIVFGEFFGMVPATFVCVFVSALGDRDSTLKSSASLAAGVTFFGCLLFSYLLQLPFPIFRWDL
jgi:hypothetical protein